MEQNKVILIKIISIGNRKVKRKHHIIV